MSVLCLHWDAAKFPLDQCEMCNETRQVEVSDSNLYVSQHAKEEEVVDADRQICHRAIWSCACGKGRFYIIKGALLAWVATHRTETVV